MSELLGAVRLFWVCAGQTSPASTRRALSLWDRVGGHLWEGGKAGDAPPVPSPVTGPLAHAGSGVLISVVP